MVGMVIKCTREQDITCFKMANGVKTKQNQNKIITLPISKSLNFFEVHKKAFSLWLQLLSLLCTQTLLLELWGQASPDHLLFFQYLCPSLCVTVEFVSSAWNAAAPCPFGHSLKDSIVFSSLDFLDSPLRLIALLVSTPVCFVHISIFLLSTLYCGVSQVLQW